MKEVGIYKLLSVFKVSPQFHQIMDGIDLIVYTDCACFIIDLCIPLYDKLKTVAEFLNRSENMPQE